MRKDTYLLPRIDNTLDALRGSQYFSALDLYSGYWQVKMDPKDIDKTAFVTRQGLFRFTTEHDRVPLLGHYLSCEGVEVDPMTTAAVQD